MCVCDGKVAVIDFSQYGHVAGVSSPQGEQ